MVTELAVPETCRALLQESLFPALEGTAGAPGFSEHRHR